ncbi:MAG: hypothetical protein V3U83_01985, partial [Acidobacteriota bacterium]
MKRKTNKKTGRGARPRGLGRRRKGIDPLLWTRTEAAAYGRRLLNVTLDHLYRDGMKRTFSGASDRDLHRLFDRPLPERGRDPSKVIEE